MAGARVQALGADDPATLGPYRLIGRLASGGMGRIYLAHGAERGGRGLVAVKTLLAEGNVSETDRRRFAREVSLAQRVDSAYTARVRDSDANAERPWMAIDYIAAPPLSELVRTCGLLPASAVRWIAAGTAEALVTLHGLGIVHRDVKPQNVLLPLDGPRLIDFGISHAADLTRTSLTLGTITFTSPEQARGEASTAASDVYSLGATLFLLATGRPPYATDGDTLRLLARVQRGELDLDGLPKELVPTIRPCLATDPAGRPEPAELLARFRRDQTGMPASHSGTRWLPPRWTELIGAYATQGLELANARPSNPAAPTVDERTNVVPPPRPTMVYTEERRARAARARALRERTRQELAALAELAERQRAEQAEREREERERVEHAERERAERERARAARQEAQRVERERAEAARQEAARAERQRSAQNQARQEAAARERARRERAERERAERERAERRRAEEAARAEQAIRSARARAAASSNASPAGGTTRPTGASSGSSSNWGWLIALAVVAALVIWQPWDTAGKASGSGGSSAGTTTSGTTTSGTVTSGSGLDTRSDDENTGTDDNESSNDAGGTSDESDDTADEPSSTPTPTPTPDATDRAFRAVRAGDCLDVYSDGHGKMSAATPVRVNCRARNAYMHVNRVTSRSGESSSCDTGQGFTWWHKTGEDGIERTLCLDRVYQVGQCFPAQVQGAVNADLTVVLSCNSSTVPRAGQSILRITGYYRAPSAGTNWTCPAGRGERFWYWQVNNGRSIICASAA